MGKKLIALNLALILMVGMVLSSSPAYAADSDGKQATVYSQAAGISTDNTQQSTVNKGIQADMISSSPYSITVNGTTFSSDVNTSGSNWSYDATENKLELTGYNGSSIMASGDLTIYSTGTDITGVSGGSPSPGIAVDGTLNLFLKGWTDIEGGDGGQIGADGIDARTLNICAEDNQCSFECSGGSGGEYGGYGIFADDIYLDPNEATITGSAGVNPGYGIVYNNSLYIGICDMTVQIDYPNGYAIATTGSNPFYYSVWDDIVDEIYQISFRVRTYTLTLNNGGGNSSGEETRLIKCRYPNFSVSLGGYVFGSNGYRQIGWASGSNLIALDDSISLTSDMTLYASWVSVQSDTVLFVGNGGKINGSDYLKRATGTSITVPSRTSTTRTSAGGTSMYLLGWTNGLILTSDSNHILNNDCSWFLPGSTVNFQDSITMYAKWVSAGNIITYNCNGGYYVSNIRSTGKVQAILGTGSDLTLYVLSDINLGFQKNDYTFTGWKDDSGSLYSIGQTISPTEDLTVTNLKAQWAKNCIIYLGGNGGTFTQDNWPFTGVDGYEGKILNLAEYIFERSGYRLVGWNTKQDGTGTAYSATDSITLAGNNLSLYAQWAPGTVFYGYGLVLTDKVTCTVINEQNRASILLSVTSLKNSTINSNSVPIYYALYQDGRLVSVISKDVALTSSGISDEADVYYPAGTAPDSCKVFILDGTNFKPAGSFILCPLQ